MLRSFRPQDFIHLPPLSEAGTLTLVDDLEAAAKAAALLPPGIVAAMAHVLETSAGIKKAIAGRERAGSSADPRARAADRALDDAWGAFQTWLLGWTRLPDSAHVKVREARALYADLFPRGLQFLTYDFKDEWKESATRLDDIGKRRDDQLIDALGGAPFLATIARAHKTYGEALHILSSPHDEADPDLVVQRALEATHMALREYVAQVAATVRRSDPGSVDVAEHLLAPLSAMSDAPIDDDLYGDRTKISASYPVT
jgi:hypothetical protein